MQEIVILDEKERDEQWFLEANAVIEELYRWKTQVRTYEVEEFGEPRTKIRPMVMTALVGQVSPCQKTSDKPAYLKLLVPFRVALDEINYYTGFELTEWEFRDILSAYGIEVPPERKKLVKPMGITIH